MSYLPVSAHTKRMPAAPQPPGKASVWQANIRTDLGQPEYNQRLEHHIDESRPIQTLEHLVPESEREGIDRNGISRKLAWLAKNGFTMNTYDEIVASQSRIKPHKPTRKERRKITNEELLIAHAEFEQELERFERELPRKSRKNKGKKAKPLGPAMVMAPRGKYALEKQPPLPHQPSEALQVPANYRRKQNVVADDIPFDASAWLDSYEQQQQQVDPPFLPETMLPSPLVPEIYVDAGSNLYDPNMHSSAYYADGYTVNGASPYSTTDSSSYSASTPSTYGASNTSSYSAYSPSVSGSVLSTQDQYACNFTQPSYGQNFLETSYDDAMERTNYVQAAQPPFLDVHQYQHNKYPTWETNNLYQPYVAEAAPALQTQTTWSQPGNGEFPHHAYPQRLYH